jgi:hypothetical protein
MLFHDQHVTARQLGPFLLSLAPRVLARPLGFGTRVVVGCNCVQPYVTGTLWTQQITK